MTHHKFFDIYKDKTGRWRWRFVTRNRRIMADSAYSYASRAAAAHARVRMCRIIRGEQQ